MSNIKKVIAGLSVLVMTLVMVFVVTVKSDSIRVVCADNRPEERKNIGTTSERFVDYADAPDPEENFKLITGIEVSDSDEALPKGYNGVYIETDDKELTDYTKSINAKVGTLSRWLAAIQYCHNDIAKRNLSYGVESGSYESTNTIDCSGYIMYCLQKAGIHVQGRYSSSTFYSNPMHWKKIYNKNEVKQGDIVVMSLYGTNASTIGDTHNLIRGSNGRYPAVKHVQIYWGNDTWYNAGSTSAIQRKSPYYSTKAWDRFICAVRPVEG